MNQNGIKTRIKLLMAFFIAAFVFTFCQPYPVKKISAPISPATPLNGVGNPEDDAVLISAMCTLTGGNATLNVPAGKPVRISWGWSALTEQQVQSYLDEQVTRVTLDGKAVSNATRGIIEPHNQKFAVFWSADVGVLAPGRHIITYTGTWKKKIEDGLESFGPGGETESLSDRCELFVK
jgi:hypothetical protein